MNALPSLKSLQAFESAARLGSFAAAAQELSVSAPAISQLVRSLEELLGRKLFHRVNRGLTLTEAGHDVLPRLSGAFAEIKSVSARLSGSHTRSKICISIPPSLSTAWLPERLPKFLQQHGEVDISVRGEQDPVDFDSENIDLRLTYGAYRYSGRTSQDLMHDHVYPVCSPQFLSSINARADIAKLEGKDLIHTDWGPEAALYPSWTTFFEYFDIQPPSNVTRGNIANSSQLAVLMAVNGMGIALGQGIFVNQFLKDGTLVRPISGAMPLNHPYCLTTRVQSVQWPSVKAFQEWLIAECLASMPSDSETQKADIKL